MSKIKQIWVEKYRPKKISEIIFYNNQQKEKFLNFVKNGEIPHLLLSGVQGSGKTTISRALVNLISIQLTCYILMHQRKIVLIL
jgi:replication-associated recombination protein RarA